jgi:deoxyribose-phosphate aldolase
MERSYIYSHRVIKVLKPFCLKVDEATIKEKLGLIASKSISGEKKLQGIRLAISIIDLTSLEGTESSGKIQAMCRQAVHPMDNDISVPHTAAVCLYPDFIKFTGEIVKGSGVRIASVTDSFPSGLVLLDTKLQEIKRAIELGADEVDMVLNWGVFLDGKIDYAYREVSEAKHVCGKIKLKVILETGKLENFDNIKKASLIALLAGADFIKTSTGRIQPAATLPATLVMLQAIEEYYSETGIKKGIKPAGGIRTTNDALSYLMLVKETLGEKWLTPDLFRIGASALLNDLLINYGEVRTGIAQSKV